MRVADRRAVSTVVGAVAGPRGAGPVIGEDPKEGDPRPTSSIDRLREETREAVARMSLPRVAREVGMASGSLRRFAEGGAITPQSRGRLFRWLRQTEMLDDERGAACVRMLQEIVVDLPVKRRIPAARELLTVLASHYKTGSGAVPAWLERGLNRLADSGGA